MNWIKQNTFLSGFIAVMVIGGGVLGWLLYSASGRYDGVRSDYETKVKELNRLESSKPYPEEANLKIFDEQKKEHAAAIQEFQKKVIAVQIPVEPISAVQFQNLLKEAVDRVVQKAAAADVKTPNPFYLGFEKYQTQPPTPEAAPALGRQLKALEFVATKLIDSQVTGFTKFERKPLPEEEGKVKKDKPDEPPARGPKVEKTGKSMASVAYHPVQIEFLAEQSRARAFLNDVVGAKDHFFVPRLVTVKNEAEAAPPRVAPGAAGTPTSEDIPVVFGLEKVHVSLELELVEFMEVAAK